MQIFENLFHALRQLQSSGMADEPIWVDAICINQSDEVEKSAQVKMMGRIFEVATMVIVWLGHASPMTGVSLDVAEPCFTGKIRDWFGKFDDKTTRNIWDEAAKVSRMAGSLRAASIILQRGWFCRVWTLQEAILAKKLVYLLGPHIIRIKDFLEHLREIPQSKEMSKPAILNRLPFRMKRIKFVNDSRKNRSKHVSCTLEEAITEARNRRAGDSRDKVFAVLSFCSTVEQNETARIDVDYQKSVQDVFCNCAVALLESRKTGLFLLSLVGQMRHGAPVEEVFNSARIEFWVPGKDFTPDLPSWVPDLNAPARPVPLREISTVQYSAALKLKSCFKVSGGTELSIRAALLGKITTVGDSLPYRVLHRPLWKFLLVPCHLNATTYRPTGEPMVSAFWRTLLAGSTHVGYGGKDGVRLSDSHFCSWLIWMATECHFTMGDEMRDGILQEEEEDEDEEMPTNLPSMGILDGFRGENFKERLRRAGASMLDAALEKSTIRKKMRDAHQFIADAMNMDNKISAVRQFIHHFDAPEYDLRAGIEGKQHGAQANPELLGATKSDIDRLTRESVVFEHAFRVFYSERKNFATVNGYMGTAPWTVQEGDVVMFVAGAYVPYVFRPAGEGAWRLIGEAYCHGAMFGEDLAMEGLNFEMIRVI